jgi:hypothetical protein
MLYANQGELPPRHSGKEERYQIHQYMNGANPRVTLLSVSHPIVLKQVISDKVSVYPVHYLSPIQTKNPLHDRRRGDIRQFGSPFEHTV